MNAWHFIAGAYVVTAIVIVIEMIAVRARFRAARSVVSEQARNDR